MAPKGRITKLAKLILRKFPPSRNQPPSNLATLGTTGLSSISTSARTSSIGSLSGLYQDSEQRCLDASQSSHEGSNWLRNGKILSEYQSAFEHISLEHVDIDYLCLDLVNSESFQEAATSQRPRESYDFAALTRHSYASVPPLFSSVCVCDDSMIGLPVYVRSRHFAYGPRSLRLGRAVFANLSRSEREGSGCCSISARGPPRAGLHERPEFFLEYHATLFPVVHDGPRGETYVLASTMNISAKITSLVIDYLNTEALHGSPMGKPSADPTFCARRSRFDIDWLMSAQEELQATCEDHLQTANGRRDHRLARTELKFLEDHVSFQVQKLSLAFRTLHRDCFLLSQSQGTGLWEIHSASYSLAFDGMRLWAGFSAASPKAQQKLLTRLKSPHPFSTLIKWETDDTFRALYCQPMYRKEFHSWMCFMVDANLPDLWAGSRWART